MAGASFSPFSCKRPFLSFLDQDDLVSVAADDPFAIKPPFIFGKYLNGVEAIP
jgi:hypothetical protein